MAESDSSKTGHTSDRLLQEKYPTERHEYNESHIAIAKMAYGYR